MPTVETLQNALDRAKDTFKQSCTACVKMLAVRGELNEEMVAKAIQKSADTICDNLKYEYELRYKKGV
ncbi:MAG: hypothetical protein LBH47_03740 [Christensenellaceae bacterium]|nr:hypothetical protein [Christensenellaceae bacterium]